MVTKRLGDGFYEQRLVREQVAQLTGGYRYFEGVHDDLTECQALMNAGATFAQRNQLIPGIALTAAQIAQLTKGIVWRHSSVAGARWAILINSTSWIQKMISSVKDMLKNRPPRFMCFLAFADLTYLVWTLFTHFSMEVAGRVVISAVLWWFVFQGSKLAGNLLGGCCALSAFLSLALIRDIASASMGAAVVAMSIPVALGWLAAYFLFGSSMRKFQNRAAERA